MSINILKNGAPIKITIQIFSKTYIFLSIHKSNIAFPITQVVFHQIVKIFFHLSALLTSQKAVFMCLLPTGECADKRSASAPSTQLTEG